LTLSLFKGQRGRSSGVTKGWPMKSGARSCSTCWQTLTKSTSIRGSSQWTCYILRKFSASNNLVACRCKEFFDQYWHHPRPSSDHEWETLLQHGLPDFITWFQRKVPSDQLSSFQVWRS
jgi:hypothetical protein